ncbi:hypothetical protein MLD52_22910, partial [Puniceicoccaceae bacterium K14]|nr:hypothetical protein [Puniceicoccaceae bacterium K14]
EWFDFDMDGTGNNSDERQELDGADLVVDFTEGSENEFWITLRLHQGTLNVTGGLLQAQKLDLWDCWIGTVNGGTGTINQSGGEVILNFLEIARSAGATGVYNLSDGSLLLPELSRKPAYNLFLGGNDGGAGGNGTFEISGGSLTTRAGVELVSGEAVFSVVGSAATSISIGGHDRAPTPAIPATDTEPAVDEVVFPAVDGAWLQQAGSTLMVTVDDGGLTPIVIEDADASGDGANIEFADGAILLPSFAGDAVEGTWTVMEFTGTVTDNGLALADGSDGWSFAIDESATPKTLSVS